MSRRDSYNLLIQALRVLKSIKVSSTNSSQIKKISDSTFKAIDLYLLEEAKKKGIPDLEENFSFSKTISAYIKKQAPDLSDADREDLLTEILSLIPDWLKRFNPEKGAKFTTMLWRNVWSKAVDYLKNKEQQETREKTIFGPEDEGYMSQDLVEDIRETTESPEEFKGLIDQIREYLGSKKIKLQKVFDMALEGLSRGEIVDRMEITAGYLSTIFSEMKRELVAFAEKQDNPELASAVRSLRLGTSKIVVSSWFGTELLPLLEEAYKEGLTFDQEELGSYCIERGSQKAADVIRGLPPKKFDDLVNFFDDYHLWAGQFD